MIKFAVILAGCGRMDGSEIHESVLTLLSICQIGASYQCFSLNLAQEHVTNHLTNENSIETRNMLTESARIARGDIKELAELEVNDFDVLVIPGGNGTAYNLFTLAKDGENYTVNTLVSSICQKFTELKKPVGFICIAPVMIPVIYKQQITMTIGTDENIANLVTKRGAKHQICNVDEVCIDHQHKIVTTPAYMLANTIGDTYLGIKKLIVTLATLI